MRRFGGHAHAAESIGAIARAAHQAVRMPAARRPCAHVQAPVAVPRPARERIAAAAVAEFFLEARAQIAGPFIGGRVRIAVMQNAQRSRHFALLMPIELLEERNQCGGVLHRYVCASRNFLEHTLMRFRSCARANRRTFGNRAAPDSRNLLNCSLYRRFLRRRIRLPDARSIVLLPGLRRLFGRRGRGERQRCTGKQGRPEL